MAIFDFSPDASAKLGLTQVEETVNKLVNLGLYFAGGVAVIFLIIGAYHYFTAFGNEEKATKAKSTITWAIVGVVFIILAKLLVTWIFTFVAKNPPSV